MIVDPLGSVERAILARLKDPARGLLASYNTLITATDTYTPPDEYSALDALAIDFNPEGTNFSLGIVEPGLLLLTSDFEYPFLMLQAVSGSEAQDSSRVKGIPFSGNVNAALRVILSYQQESVTDFTTWASAVSAAMIATFNAPLNNLWAPGINYNGGISVQKSRPFIGGENWLVVLDFQAVFYCVLQG